jgi:hypothetical protein
VGQALGKGNKDHAGDCPEHGDDSLPYQGLVQGEHGEAIDNRRSGSKDGGDIGGGDVDESTGVAVVGPQPEGQERESQEAGVHQPGLLSRLEAHPGVEEPLLQRRRQQRLLLHIPMVC